MSALSRRALHPFPARMAPEISEAVIGSLPAGSRVLDPMCGSGSVLRAAVERGLDVIGVDIDPLAVLMAKVWSSRIDASRLLHDAHDALGRARDRQSRDISLPWHDDETLEFVSYWFGEKQQAQLAAIAGVLHDLDGPAIDALRLALSRIIISKDRGASLARDVSHSRPHRAWYENDFDVYDGFLRSCRAIATRAAPEKVLGRSTVRHGDCRRLEFVDDRSLDAVITSPPYLNALDYLRGHRLSLVWLGYTVSQIRKLRSDSVGSERGAETDVDLERYITSVDGSVLPARQRGWVARFVNDSQGLVAEIKRVLRQRGCLVMVIGDSVLRGSQVRNSDIICDLLQASDFEVRSRVEREIPNQNRYLPPPSGSSTLAARMRTEVIVTARYVGPPT